MSKLNERAGEPESQRAEETGRVGDGVPDVPQSLPLLTKGRWREAPEGIRAWLKDIPSVSLRLTAPLSI